MKKIEKILFGALIVGVWAVSGLSAQEMTDFARYEVILQRQPFGIPPANPAGAEGGAPPPPVEDVFKNYRVVGITEGDDKGDLSVGIVDLGIQPPISIFLNVGDSDAGLTLVKADYELEGALIRKGNEEKWLYLGGLMPSGAGPAVVSEVGESNNGRPGGSKGVASYIERMRARREALRSQPPEPAKYTGEELEKHLREYNMELIRAAAKGESKGPPLPIPLTVDEDKQLVAEGVLAPSE